MAAPRRDLLFRFLGDSKDLQRASERAQRSLGGVDQKSRATDKGMAVLRKGAIALGTVMATGQLYQGMKSAVLRAQEMDSKYAITSKIIEDTGGAAHLTARQIQDMSKEMSMATGLDKSVVTDAANVLLTFTNIKDVAGENNDIFTESLKLTGDMAAVFGGSAKDAAKQLGKALQDPIGGISALSRVGVQFTDQQKDQIKALVDTGDVLGAQKIILGELETQVGGTAEASADATAKIARGWDEVMEVIGDELLPLVEDATPKLVGFFSGAEKAMLNFNIAMNTVDKKSRSLNDALDWMVGPNINFGGSWDEASEAMLRWQKIQVLVIDGLRNGADPTRLAIEMLARMAEQGIATADNVKQLQDRVGLSNEEMGYAAKAASVYAGSIGAAADDVDTLRDSTEDLRKEYATKAVRAQDKFTESAMDLAYETKQAAETTDDLSDSVVNLADEMKKLTDPVFRAESAVDAYNEALATALEDGELTADEIQNVTEKYVDMQAATDDLSPENLEAYNEAAQEAFAGTGQSIHDAGAELDVFTDGVAGSGFDALEGLVSRLESVSGRKISIDLAGLRMASRAEIEQAVTRALWSAMRTGSIGNVYL